MQGGEPGPLDRKWASFSRIPDSSGADGNRWVARCYGSCVAPTYSDQGAVRSMPTLTISAAFRTRLQKAAFSISPPRASVIFGSDARPRCYNTLELLWGPGCHKMLAQLGIQTWFTWWTQRFQKGIHGAKANLTYCSLFDFFGTEELFFFPLFL